MVVGGGGAAGEAGDALLLAVLDDLDVQTGGDNKLAAGGDGLIHLLGGEDGAGTHQHLGVALNHDLHGFVGTGSPEGDFRHAHAAGAQSVGQGCGIPGGIGQLDDRHNADGADLLLQFVHWIFLLCFLSGKNH